MRLLELLERRAAVLELVSDALEPRRPSSTSAPGSAATSTTT